MTNITCRKLFFVLFFLLVQINTPNVNADIIAKEDLSFLITDPKLCYWVDKVGGRPGYVKADTSKTAGAPLTCVGTLKCFSPHPVLPDTYFENLACQGKQLASGRVDCGDSEQLMKCLEYNLSNFKTVRSGKQDRTFSTGPAGTLRPEFKDAEVAK